MRSKADDYTDGMAKLAKIFADRDSFANDSIPLMKKFLKKQHPLLRDCAPGFHTYIFRRSLYAAITLWEKMTNIARCTEENILPGNCSDLDAERMKKHLTRYCTPPEIVTEKKYKHLKGYLQKWIDEENTGNYNRWKRQEDYVAAFINAIQEIIISRLPVLLNMEGDWWLVYKYFMRDAARSFQHRAEMAEELIKCGLGAEWLEKPRKERKKKMNEIWDERENNRNEH